MNEKTQSSLVSICIPVYNNAEYLEETIMSVLNQTYPDIELVLVDDHSADCSLDVIRKTLGRALQAGKVDRIEDCTGVQLVFKSRSDRDHGNVISEVDFPGSGVPDIQAPGERTAYFFSNSENLGMAGNWNRCMELCRGQYVKLLCADDQLAPESVAREVEAMVAHPEVLLVESDTEFRDKKNRPSGSYPRYKRGVVQGRKIARHSLFTRDYFGAPLANLIRMSAYKAYGGFDPSFRFIIDYDFYMNLACHGKVFVIREALNYFRIREDSNTGEVLNGDQGAAYLAEHHHLTEKYAGELRLSDFQVWVSVQIRRIMNVLGGIYLKYRLRDKKREL
jgi:glycosyltransferase involved in cell wall biosynthesis